MVYIHEAHAADSKWSIPIKGEEPIYNPKTLGERRAVATKCVTKLNIELPCLVDNIDDTVGKAYHAWPDRLFVVDKEGNIAVRADPGPWGFGPSVKKAKQWLASQFPDVARASGGDQAKGTR